MQIKEIKHSTNYSKHKGLEVTVDRNTLNPLVTEISNPNKKVAAKIEKDFHALENPTLLSLLDILDKYKTQFIKKTQLNCKQEEYHREILRVFETNGTDTEKIKDELRQRFKKELAKVENLSKKSDSRGEAFSAINRMLKTKFDKAESSIATEMWDKKGNTLLTGEKFEKGILDWLRDLHGVEAKEYERPKFQNLPPCNDEKAKEI